MDCRRIQKHFSEALLVQSSHEQRPAEVTFFESLLSSDGKISASAGIEAYRGNWRAGLRSALADFYPAMRGLLGEECFGQLAAMFVDLNPAKEGDLNCYGQWFSNFVETEFSELPYLKEVAELEWLWHRMFYMEDENIISSEEINQALELETHEIYFKLSGSLSLISSSYSLKQVWEYGRSKSKNEESKNSSDKDISFDLSSDQFLLIWRQGYKQQSKILSLDERDFILGIQAKKSLQEIGEGTLSHLEESDLTNLLAAALQHQWLASVGSLRSL
jgi:hypothetical protein